APIVTTRVAVKELGAQKLSVYPFEFVSAIRNEMEVHSRLTEAASSLSKSKCDPSNERANEEREDSKFVLKMIGVSAILQNPLIVTELMDGSETLNSVLIRCDENEDERFDLMAITQRLGWGEQIGRALRFMHRHNCVHRDCTPNNILVCF